MSASHLNSNVPGNVSAEALSELAVAHVKELDPDAGSHLMDLGFNLVRASGKYTQVSEAKVLRAHDLRWASFSVLFMVSLFPGIEARIIAKLTGVTRQATSQVLITLEKAGHIIRRQADPADKRLMEVSLTDQGREVLSEAMTEHMQSSAEWFGKITDEEQHELNRLVKKLLAG